MIARTSALLVVLALSVGAGAQSVPTGFTDEVIHLYLAQQLRPGKQALEADEVLTVEAVPFADAIQMCLQGEIRDAKSICALMLAAARRGQT